MTGIVNRVPFGLLDLLDMKARGQTPRFLSGELSGDIELRDLYLLQDREIVFGQTDPITAAGQWGDTSSPARTLVPQNEVWYLWNLTVFPTATLNGGAGELRFSAGVLSGAFPALATMGPQLDWVPTGGDFPSWFASPGWWMRGGDTIAVLVSQFTAFTADPELILAATVTKLQV